MPLVMTKTMTMEMVSDDIDNIDTDDDDADDDDDEEDDDDDGHDDDDHHHHDDGDDGGMTQKPSVVSLPSACIGHPHPSPARSAYGA